MRSDSRECDWASSTGNPPIALARVEQDCRFLEAVFLPGGVLPRHVKPPVQCVGSTVCGQHSVRAAWGGGDTLVRVRSQAGCSYL